MERREFIKTAIAAAAPLAGEHVFESLGPIAAAAEPETATQPTRSAETVRGEMIYRPLGRTGEKVSVLGLGGAHIGRQPEEQESIRIIRTAVDHGITFMDNCWDYNGGNSERRMGKALRDGYREKVFLMTKIDGRTQQTAAEQIDESLRRLGTDHLDLLQFHEVIRLEDPDLILRRRRGRGGHAGRAKGGQDSFYRLYRPQGPAGPPPDARHGPAGTTFASIRSRCR